MRIEIKDRQGNPRLTVHVDPAQPPTVVKATDGRGPAVSLDWNQTLDDKDQLRHCPICTCPDLYAKKQVPQLTVFVLIIAAGSLATALFGIGLGRPAMIVLAVVVVLDIVIWFTAPRFMVCYRCRSEFHDTSVIGRATSWNAAIADRYPGPESGSPRDTPTNSL